MRLGKEQAAGYVEDTGHIEDTGHLEDTATAALPVPEPLVGEADGMPATTAPEPPLTVR
jgi:hypothetical protein